jgi:hypothetical protein
MQTGICVQKNSKLNFTNIPVLGMTDREVSIWNEATQCGEN